MLLVLYLFVLKFGAGFVWGLFAAVAAPPTPVPSCPEPHPAAAARAQGLQHRGAQGAASGPLLSLAVFFQCSVCHVWTLG